MGVKIYLLFVSKFSWKMQKLQKRMGEAGRAQPGRRPRGHSRRRPLPLFLSSWRATAAADLPE